MAQEVPTPPVTPIKALLVTGGASHDYSAQGEMLTTGISERVKRPIEWTVISQGDSRGDVEIPIFQQASWADGYDIVVHNYCFPRVRNQSYVERILGPHRTGKPALLIHGTLQSFRGLGETWTSFTGAVTDSHEEVRPLPIKWLDPDDPVVSGLPNWTTPAGQLYQIDSLISGAKTLAAAPAVDGKTRHPVVWHHRYGPSAAKVFATSLGNDRTTMASPVYLDMLARGFLWSLSQLSDTAIITVPPDQSLKGIAAISDPVLRINPGRGDLAEPSASALTENSAEGHVSNHAIDGNDLTFWEAETVGPASFSLSWDKPQQLSALFINWRGRPPASFLIEGWHREENTFRAMPASEVSNDSTTTLKFAPQEAVARVRISIPESRPGEVIGIREILAYGNETVIPAALLSQISDELPLLRSGSGSLSSQIGLREGWSLNHHLLLEQGFVPTQLVPAAEGMLFAVIESKGKASVKQFSWGSGPEVATFLPELSLGVSIAWDGEWLYVIEGQRLQVLRDTSGDGIADEEKSSVSLFRGGEKAAPTIRDLQIGINGWCYGRLESKRPVEVVAENERRLLLPKHGLVRFQHDGTGFEVIAESSEPIRRFTIDSELRLFAEAEGRFVRLSAIAGKNWSGCEPIKLIPSPDNKSAGSPQATEVADDDAFQIEDDRYGLVSPASGKSAIIGQAEGLRQVSGDRDRHWLLVEQTNGTFGIAQVLRDGAHESTFRWDETRLSSLFPLLNDQSAMTRREAVFEVLRRKRPDVSDITSLLQDPHSLGFVGALGILSQERSEEGHQAIVEAARLSHHPLAFRLLGDQPEMRNHSIFNEVTAAKRPETTAEILAAIQRSNTDVPGLNELALRFAANEDKHLSETAQAFLIQRGAETTCTAVLKELTSAGAITPLGETAFALLAKIATPTALQGLVSAYEQAKHPATRDACLATLAAIYHKVDEEKSQIDAVIADALKSRRVNHDALLNEMVFHEIPVPAWDSLTEIAMDRSSLEEATLRLIQQEDVVPPAVIPLLKQIALSESRDGILRNEAAKCLLAAEDLEERDRKRIATIATIAMGGTAAIGQSAAVGPTPQPPLLARIGNHTAASGAASAGRVVFERERCGACHNIYGEGSHFGPDLVELASTEEPAAFLAAMSEPYHRDDDRVIQLRTGPILRATVLANEEGGRQLRDLAGNRFSVNEKDVHEEWEAEPILRAEHQLDHLSAEEFHDLFSYLAGLAAP